MKKIFLIAFMALAMCPTMLAAPVTMPGDNTESTMTPDQELHFYIDALSSLIANGGTDKDNPLTALKIDDKSKTVVMHMKLDDAESVQMLSQYPDMFKPMLVKELVDGDDDMKEFFGLIASTGHNFDLVIDVPGKSTSAKLSLTPAELKAALKK